MVAPHAQLTAPRREALRDTLLATVDLLRRCKAAEVPAGDIDDYVALNWLEWNGGSLRLTEVGDNMCKQVNAGLA
ncbi:hypothetical protein LRS03_13495 [Rhizobacter sp. J219]|jgi:hypothetical protein|uniref:hypothetical protein n=1 Tax=Rhizobacter sp. J219 TaxID=2898430 RepID=UPI002151AAB5|nr:hypothetical protein [Rhizobacter sp. J219]MCR5883815.1 hypothetical protein [Rhizobacter sp. J219]